MGRNYISVINGNINDVIQSIMVYIKSAIDGAGLSTTGSLLSIFMNNLLKGNWIVKRKIGKYDADLINL
ncbi:MAG: hypothetical protein IPJ16_02255 [Bacteroidales bacterium]|nr:hypothetical protein [Bacteroidales bacterium]